MLTFPGRIGVAGDLSPRGYEQNRMNGEVRDREKVMRGLKIPDSKTLPGYQIYHNHFRPHMALNGMTPVEKCGIKIEGENKWQTNANAVKQEGARKNAKEK